MQGTKELHIAPMLDVTYREFRYFMRLLTRRAVLWTEMVVDETIHHADPVDAYHLLDNSGVSPPCICQLGGNRVDLAASVTQRILSCRDDSSRDDDDDDDDGDDYHYQRQYPYYYEEVNLNCECPSERVAHRRAFGAALMHDIPLTVQMLQQMQQGANNSSNNNNVAVGESASTGGSRTTNAANVSIKLRIGIDEHDDWDFIHGVIAQLSVVCRRFVLHARKVYTQGLDPAQNRRVPPLHYPRVYALCRAFPDCDFWINGGIRTLKQAYDICYANTSSCSSQGTDDDYNDNYIPPGHDGGIPCPTCQAPFGSCITPPLQTPPNLRGCLVGRAAMDHPVQFAVTDTYFYGAPPPTRNPCPCRRVLLLRYADFLETVYPRRCCDDDNDILTFRYPAPKVTHTRQFCPVCRPSNDNKNEDKGNKTMVDPSSSPVALQGQVDQNTNENPANAKAHKQNPNKRKHACKITKHIIHRSLKPTMGVFFGIPGASKAWRRTLDQLTNCTNVRNCGPAFLLRRAMQQMPQHVLDRSLDEEMTPK